MASVLLTEAQYRTIEEIKKLAFYDREEKIAVVFHAGKDRGIAFFNQLFLKGIEIKPDPFDPAAFTLSFREMNSGTSQQLRFNVGPSGQIIFEPSHEHIKESLRMHSQHAKALEELEKISLFIASLKSNRI